VKVPRACDVIQGDGINLDDIREILAAVQDKGFSAQERFHAPWRGGGGSVVPDLIPMKMHLSWLEDKHGLSKKCRTSFFERHPGVGTLWTYPGVGHDMHSTSP